jgi:hypothetical protein
MPARSSAKTSDSSSCGPVPPSLNGSANLSRSGGMRYPRSGPWKLITATERPEDSICAATAHGSLQPVFAPYRRISHTASRSVVTLRDGVRRLRSSCPHRHAGQVLIDLSQATSSDRLFEKATFMMRNLEGQVQVLILLVTWHVADLGSRPASHQFVRDVFSSICHILSDRTPRPE